MLIRNWQKQHFPLIIEKQLHVIKTKYLVGYGLKLFTRRKNKVMREGCKASIYYRAQKSPPTTITTSTLCRWCVKNWESTQASSEVQNYIYISIHDYVYKQYMYIYICLYIQTSYSQQKFHCFKIKGMQWCWMSWNLTYIYRNYVWRAF